MRAQALEPYPPGRWRLATPEELDRSMVWGAHILVAHKDAEPRAVSFRLLEWTPSVPLPARSRSEALELAQKIGARARANPEAFPALAREHSDDFSTRDSGGSFAGVTAYQLTEWPELLDVLQTLKVDEVSRVVETAYGFHVFSRTPPPLERRLSGSRIVIAYDQAPWTQLHLSWRAVPSRSRADALDLANRLYEQLRQTPGDFERLVHDYSDHRDALRGGDFGEWSTREPTPLPRELEQLGRLEVGEIGQPFDSPLGVQIVRRTGERSRRRYSMTLLQRGFEAERADSEPTSRASVVRDLVQLMPALRAGTASLTELQTKFCCSEVTTWVEGRGDPLDEASLGDLAIGEISREPIVRPTSAALVQRLAPEPESASTSSVELPAPLSPDLDYWIGRNGSADMLRTTADRVRSTRSLSPEAAAELSTLGAYAERVEQANSRESRLASFQELQARLGTEGLAAYRGALETYIAEQLMRVDPQPSPLVVEGMPVLRWPAL